MKKWEKYSKSEIEAIVADVCTYSELSKRLGYNGSTRFDAMKDMIQELNLDISHFCNPKKGKFDYSRFVYGKEMKGPTMIRALIALRGHRCENCGLEQWMDNPIVLEVHHKDGDRLNNELDNLQLLCPNCHSITFNWKGKNDNGNQKPDYVTDDEILSAIQNGKNIRQTLKDAGLSDHGSNYRRIKKIADKNNIELYAEKNEKNDNHCIDCGRQIASQYIRCDSCNRKLRKLQGVEQLPVNRNELKHLIRNNNFIQIGQMFDVSDNAIRKWCKKLNLPYRTSDIKKYSDIEWESI